MTCPKCGSDSVVQLLVYRSDGMSQYRCQKCGHDWVYPVAPEVFFIVTYATEPGKWYLNGKPLDDAAQAAIELAEENKRLREAISKHCKDCWAFRGQDPAQCRICALREFKENHNAGEQTHE